MKTPDGKRHTIAAESESVYNAAMKFFGRSGAEFLGDRLPKTGSDTVFEVRPIYQVTQNQLMEWANNKAEIYARSKKFRKWR